MKIHDKILALSLTVIDVSGFTLTFNPTLKFSAIKKNISPNVQLDALTNTESEIGNDYLNESKGNSFMVTNYDRRSILTKLAQSSLGVVTSNILLDSTAGRIPTAEAAVGTLPEFAETNAVLQGITLNVADFSQYEKMLNFLTDSFDFKILRQRELNGITEAVSSIDINSPLRFLNLYSKKNV